MSCMMPPPYISAVQFVTEQLYIVVDPLYRYMPPPNAPAVQPSMRTLSMLDPAPMLKPPAILPEVQFEMDGPPLRSAEPSRQNTDVP